MAAEFHLYHHAGHGSVQAKEQMQKTGWRWQFVFGKSKSIRVSVLLKIIKLIWKGESIQ